jgi:putative transposase
MSIWRRFDHGFPSLLTTNVEGRRPIFRDRAAARFLVEVIHEIAAEEAFQLIAYVVMPDHLHLVAWPRPPVTAGRVMKMIKGRFARRYQAERGQRGAFWQSRYHEEALQSDEALWAAVEYVHHNPVVAGLAENSIEYPWSSASRDSGSGFLGESPLETTRHGGRVARACPYSGVRFQPDTGGG